jgi:dTDP-4-dehydrorhamnose reductase
LVLGGSGNLGATLCARARERGHDVLATCNQRAPALEGVRWVKWNVADSPPPAELGTWAAAVVVHCVAIIHPDTCQRQPDRARLVNAESVREAAALAGNGRLVYVSSDYVFDGRQGGYREEDSPGPVNVYGETKLLGEQHARQARQWLIARLALFGAGLPGLPPTRTEEQLASLRRGEEVTVAADQVGTPLWTHTAAALLLELIERGATGVVHAAGPEPVSKETLLRRLAIAAGIASPQVRGVPTAELRPPAPRPLNVSLRASAMVTGLAAYPRTLAEDLRRYAALLR